MVRMQTVDSVAGHSPSAQFFRFMSVPTGRTNPITVVTVISPLTIQTSCARMLSFTLARNHSSAAIVIDHSREQRLFTTTCARTLAKNHLHAIDAERILPRPHSYISTRDYRETVFHTKACLSRRSKTFGLKRKTWINRQPKNNANLPARASHTGSRFEVDFNDKGLVSIEIYIVKSFKREHRCFGFYLCFA